MRRTLTLILLAAALPLGAQQPVFNRAPLEPTRYAALPLGEVTPKGWLKDMLRAQADGMTGHLDELYGKIVGPDNAWIGGEGDTWERGPYWIDGLLPLAYILQDEALIAKSLKWTEAMITSAAEDGYFGNRISRSYIEGFQRGKAEDWWPKMVALKILKQYYEATGDTRALDVMKGYFRYQAKHLDATPIGHWSFWGEWRAADNIDAAFWLYNITGDESLLALTKKIYSQSVDFTELFYDGTRLTTQNDIHCVNLAQGFKLPIVWWQLTHDVRDLAAPEAGYDIIRHTIGLPTELWAGDELLDFGEPTRGSELCTAVEMCYSLEEMLRISGNPLWGDKLERVAFNALPAQVTDIWDSRQYFQQTNQIACTYERRNFVTDHGGTDNVFSLLGGYPCCTCNMHQAWPKFTRNLWYATQDGGLAALVYAPSKVSTTVGGEKVSITEDTLYPFDGEISLRIDFPARKGKKASAALEFPLWLRIPSWCSAPVVKVAGEEIPVTPGRIICVKRAWKKGDTVQLSFPMDIAPEKWWDGSTVVTRGPLLYALKLEENWTRKEFPTEKLRDKYGPFYYEVTTASPWNYGFSKKALGKPDETFRVELRDVAPYWTQDRAPVVIHAKALIMKDWKAYNGSTGPMRYFKETAGDTGGEAEIELIPYGCTTLRITEFPTRK